MNSTQTLSRQATPVTDTFSVRRAYFPEMKLIANFVRSSAHWYREILDPADMDEHDVDDQWATRNYKLRDFYLGLDGDTPVGTISLQYFKDVAYLGYIYLDVNQVGKGYGRKLMKFAESVARQKGMKAMALIAHPEATWACKAYLKYGFEVTEATKEGVLSWNGGVLAPYYEEGFQLYEFDF